MCYVEKSCQSSRGKGRDWVVGSNPPGGHWSLGGESTWSGPLGKTNITPREGRDGALAYLTNVLANTFAGPPGPGSHLANSSAEFQGGSLRPDRGWENSWAAWMTTQWSCDFQGVILWMGDNSGHCPWFSSGWGWLGFPLGSQKGWALRGCAILLVCAAFE